jgi:Flp pilus assembly protein TadB
MGRRSCLTRSMELLDWGLLVSDMGRQVTARDIVLIVLGFLLIAAGVFTISVGLPPWISLVLAAVGGFLLRPVLWFWS